jgi:acetoin utilization protein AcuB
LIDFSDNKGDVNDINKKHASILRLYLNNNIQYKYTKFSYRDAGSMAMKAQDIMVKNVICVEMDERLPNIRKIMETNGFHHIPVTEKGKLVGIISDRDLLRLISPFINKVSEQPRDLDTLNRAAHQAMTRQPITVKADTSIEEIIAWFKRVDISCLPVVDDEHNVIGIISWRDLIHHATFKS